MHVTLVTSAFLSPQRADFPGVRRYSTELVGALERKGISIRVITPNPDEAVHSLPGRVEVVGLDGGWKRLGRAANIAQARSLGFARLVARTGWLFQDTDVVHTTIPLLSIDSVRARKPIVAMAHHVERVRSPRDLATIPFGNSYGAYTFHRADAVVVPSKATADRLALRFNVSHRRIRVIPHGVDTSKFFPQSGPAMTSLSGFREVLFVGPMTARKNVLLLLDAFLRLVREDSRLRLRLVGVGPLDRRIDKIAESATLRGKVVRMRNLMDAELRHVYGSASIYASPSLDEGFGFSVAEAMACRVPVVVLDTEASREVVGDAGLLVADTSPESWASALKHVLDNADVAEALAERGHKRAREHFSWNAAADAHIRMYREVTAARDA